MDCQLARSTLDAARPDRTDWDSPEMSEAAAHLEQCDECQVHLGGWQRWDEEVAAALGDVEIPPGLEQRLLAAVTTAGGPTPSTSVPGSRRGLWRMLISTAALAVFAIGGWWLRPQPVATYSLEAVYEALDAALPSEVGNVASAGLGQFDATFESAPEDPVWLETVAGAEPRGIELDGLPGHDAAAYHFASGRVQGWLVVLPRSRLGDAPAATVPSHAFYRYGPRPQVAWSSAERVYVCVLERGSLDDLRREFYGTAA